MGANYREANRARSRLDFRSRIKICESEANETLYWLEIINDLKWISSEDLDPVIKECSEFLAIYSTIGSKLS
ncbi:MAG: four helix bundle protein [Bacteroidales bacterium]|nr:four helix bundle protein [Bacteroidales bacterium]